MDELVSKQAVLDEVARWRGYLDDDMINRIQIGMKRLPGISTDAEVAYQQGRAAAYKDCTKQINKLRQMLEGGTPT